MAEQDKMEKIISLCTRRGIVFPTSDIYGSFAGFFDYGNYGVELKRNLEQHWWKFFVQDREDVVGIDGAIIAHPSIWKASGHLQAFNDPLVECKKCHLRFRADHLVESKLNISIDGLPLEKLQELIQQHKIVCPNCKGEFTVAKMFNLMFKTNIGPVEDENSVAYLRPETAQLIFAAFKPILFSSRKQLPFGIAQIGKAFRNEISPRNFVIRCREFSQMEIEYFLHPKKLDDCTLLSSELLSIKIMALTADAQEKKKPAVEKTIKQLLDEKVIHTKWHAYWIAESLQWFKSLGLSRQKLRLREHVKTELSHYSSSTFDVEYLYPWGWKELQGIANRTDYDLKQHMQHSGKDLTYFDEESKEKVVPFVIEPSWGLERTLLTVLLDSHEEKEDNGEMKTVLRLNPLLSPVKAAVFPLMKKDGLAEKAREIFGSLKKEFACEYDASGSIGKRYARHDEIGTPFCITVDYDTLKDGTVTIRERDSTKQKRVKASDLPSIIKNLLLGSSFESVVP